MLCKNSEVTLTRARVTAGCGSSIDVSGPSGATPVGNEQLGQVVVGLITGGRNYS